MGWRTVVITKPSKISIENDQLKYAPKDGEVIKVPIDDISVIILEIHQVTITSALLSRITESNIVLFTCDKTHAPNGVFIPFHQHSRYAQVSHKQVAWSEPFKKRIWQQIVSAKVLNQSQTLAYMKKEKVKQLKKYSQNVKSGDSTKIESTAARIYFSALFGKFNRRNEDDWRNSALNYGYALIRGAISRSLASHGFLPAFGLFHHSTLNAFNLSNDLIEPYRAFIDVVVAEHFEEFIELPETRFLPEHKIELYQLFTMKTMINNESTTLLNSVEVCVTSLMNATIEKDFTLLKLPYLDNKDE
ncbi:type II CRISPR-associated endonuclease Cas1 [bacterium]|nr:type II CRISPR-associated endonuclease Cas1 [bacterium]MBU1957013.1 type II CRISPR-associated endonuclease Cas1 [bacterium]